MAPQTQIPWKLKYSGSSTSEVLRMKSDIIIQLHKNFEDYAHQVDGEEFWFARDLQRLLGYSKWENFAKVIDKAKIACQTAGHLVADHFPDVRKTIPRPKEKQRKNSGQA